jgi:hypothetical protein
MADRDKINKFKMTQYAQEKMESNKQKEFFQMLRKEVEIGANGTSKYMIKNGPNKGRFVMIETVIVLLFFINDKLVEHRIQDSISECLKHKRLITRNMSMTNKSIQCIETEAEIEINVDGSKTIKKLIMKK